MICVCKHFEEDVYQRDLKARARVSLVAEDLVPSSSDCGDEGNRVEECAEEAHSELNPVGNFLQRHHV